ncbi:hypothetical protein SNL152K_4764 [Streptomyces sp. NL15-2K]|nr:hypothetical protein SNL152K_4764 [Streptomyces sp. NL15-2K]
MCFSDQGMLVRSVLRTRLIPWRDVAGVEALRSPLGRSVLVHRLTGFGGRRVILPSPRTHLFARDPDFDTKVASIQRWRDRLSSAPRTAPTSAVRRLWYLCAYLAIPTLMLTQSLLLEGGYWSQTWWPWRHEATSLPNACQVFDRVPARARGLVGEAEGDPYGSGAPGGRGAQKTECQWESGSDLGFRLSFRRYDYAWLKTGSRHARETFYEEKGWEQPAVLQPLEGLGDVAVIRDPGQTQPDRTNLVEAKVLKSNVIIQVSYMGKMEPHTAADKVEEIARIATTRIKPSFQHRLLGLFEV